ncbi:helix-turn-helix domain-containing protein [Streptomyces sp. NPDC051183]|uniref:helix-turn-helix domain-containing protein n=1 Tax=Streptomyces sp. NPDC051183 TaxID=3155165 RepID=UPI0034281035
MTDRISGEEARRIKREHLGVGDRTKHQDRKATPLKGLVREPGTQQRVYRFRFYPTPEQAAQLTRTFGACRWVYNEGLALRVKAWEECGTTHDRDTNAAVNLRDEGMRLYWSVAAGLPPGRVPPSVIRASEVGELVPAA